MGTSRTDLFSEEQNQLARWAHALAHPARIAILQHLLNANQCITNELVGEIGLAQSTVSQHLKELKQAGLIQGTVSGTRMCYCIHPDVWEDASRQLAQFFERYTPLEQTC